ncbi:MAG: hypothetical protein WBA84_03915 [Carnobacterium sp.]|uniref:hypothetical protein n=1 Tax=Carnobacterium sp. TaxID=48221 RepID=UPI003C795BF0
MNELEKIKVAVEVLEDKVNELMADKQAKEDELMGNEEYMYEDWLMDLDEKEAWVVEWNRQHGK